MKFPRLTYKPKGLTLHDEHFEQLHQARDKVRSNSKTVTFPREAAFRLLNDYSILMAHIEELEQALRSPSGSKEAKALARKLTEVEEEDGRELV